MGWGWGGDGLLRGGKPLGRQEAVQTSGVPKRMFENPEGTLIQRGCCPLIPSPSTVLACYTQNVKYS